MQLVTSSWFTPLPDTFARIGISRGIPRSERGVYRMYRQLQPGPWFRAVAPEEYVRLYQLEVLSQLKPDRVLRDILVLADGKPPALLCWEPADGDAFCHRGLVSAWLHTHLGLAVREYGQSPDAYGPTHPKLPAFLRAAVPTAAVG